MKQLQLGTCIDIETVLIYVFCFLNARYNNKKTILYRTGSIGILCKKNITFSF